jgi:RNA polymerase sigma-70 factor (ECF subfamily)
VSSTDSTTRSIGIDDQSQRWVDALRASGADRDRAIGELHELLLRAARFEVNRRAQTAGVGSAEADDLAQQSADDALVAVLAKLDGYRRASRFTTWAYKFALLEAGVKMRKRAWQDREITLEPELWPTMADRAAGPAEDAETSELLGALRRAIDTELTPHQRDVLVAITLNDVPIDVLAEELSTTRGALYKTLHDARRKLRQRLASDGLALEDAYQGGHS